MKTKYNPNDPFQDMASQRERQASLNAFNFELFALGALDYEDPAAVQKRIEDVFDVFAKYGEKMNYVSFALGLGFANRQKLDMIRDGKTLGGRPIVENPESVELIRRACFIVESMWASMMQSGEINTLAAIYMGKNYFKMRDQADLSIIDNTPRIAMTAEQIRAKYGRQILADDAEFAHDINLLQAGEKSIDSPFEDK